jgi:hypothetical protein
MAQTHYYYAINRKAAERIFDLTWNQFLQKFGWSKRRSQWPKIGEYLAFCLDRPTLDDEPTPEEIAPILRWTIRKTVPRMGLQYFCIVELGYALGKWSFTRAELERGYLLGKRSFIRANVDAEKLESDVDALNMCAISAFLSGDIDARTLCCVLTIHSFELPDLGKVERRRINTAIRQFGPYRPRPLFDWQPGSAVRDGHTVLFEEDTRRFARFVRLAWQHDWPVYSKDSSGLHLVRFRSFELAKRLHGACRALPGNCLVHYWGP